MYICIRLVSIIITDLAVVTHTYLELIVDFDRKVLEGKAILDIERTSSANEIVSENLFHVKKECFMILIYI